MGDVQQFSYDMGHKRRGKAIILNHKDFDDEKLGTRNGTDEDRDCLNDTFTNLGFDVEIYENLTVKKIKAKLRDLSEEDHSEADCVLVTILTHGGKEGRLYDSDGVDYSEDTLWDPFSNDKLSSLAGKPKIFIIQACRGDKDQGKLVRSATCTDTVPIAPGAAFQRIPNFADFLIFRSTPSGYVSWREQSGTWFIQALCKVLDSTLGRGDFSKDLLTLFTRVSHEVCKEETYPDEKKQIPEVCSRLTKDIYFNKKKNETL